MNVISLNFLEKINKFIYSSSFIPSISKHSKRQIIPPLFSLFFFSPSSNTQSAILISNPRPHFCPQFLLSHFRSSAKRQKGYKEVMLTLPPVYKSKQQEEIQHKNKKNTQNAQKPKQNQQQQATCQGKKNPATVSILQPQSHRA